MYFSIIVGRNTAVIVLKVFYLTKLPLPWENMQSFVTNFLLQHFKTHQCCGMDQYFISIVMYHFVNIPYFTYPFINWGTFGLFLLWGINSAAKNIQIFVWTCVLISFEYMSRVEIEIIESHGTSIFNHFRNCQTVFQSGYTPFYILAINIWGFRFLHVLLSTCYSLSPSVHSLPFLFETRSCYVASAVPELSILLPHSPKRLGL